MSFVCVVHRPFRTAQRAGGEHDILGKLKMHGEKTLRIERFIFSLHEGDKWRIRKY